MQINMLIRLAPKTSYVKLSETIQQEIYGNNVTSVIKLRRFGATKLRIITRPNERLYNRHSEKQYTITVRSQSSIYSDTGARYENYDIAVSGNLEIY